MINRHADYVKSGDKLRAEAMKSVLEIFKKKYGKKIL